MIAQIRAASKGFGAKELYKNLEIKIQAGEKIGLIGRNGTGKSTLFNLITGLDTDFDGAISLRKGASLVFSRQEHHGFEETHVLEYILADLPEYTKLKHIIETYPEHMGESTRRLQTYSDALERFAMLGYYDVENDVAKIFADYLIGNDVIHKKIGELSGGQKRLVELVKIQRSRADIALIDEPTNHMDYIAKGSFISWLKSAQEAVIVITHDRDVLRSVDRIIEIRDGGALSFPGNYQAYLGQNMLRASSSVTEYENNLRSLKKLSLQIKDAVKHKLQAPPDQAKKWRILEDRLRREYQKIERATNKPSLWIDKESVADLGTKLSQGYQEHKARNIRVRTKAGSDKSDRLLLRVDDVALGYGDSPLFSPISFDLRVHSRIELKGRNGAGKTTLVQAIRSTVSGVKPQSSVFSGYIEHEKTLRIGVYEQEISAKYLKSSLGQAIEQLYVERGLSVTNETVRQLLSDYLFNPHTDYDAPVQQLSGGQKARFQLIGMLAGDPQILILDEPTNHLDLPSIEELEDALSQYHGAIVYISHDSYFTKNIGGETIVITPAS